MSKYKIPLKLAKELNYKANPNLRYIYNDFLNYKEDGIFLFLSDKDFSSDFFFSVGEKDETHKYIVTYKPITADRIKEITTVCEIDHTVKLLKDWLNIVSEFHKTEIFSSDPIVQGFADDYYTEINLIDEDADVKPFSSKQILALDEYLESVENKIDDFKDGTNDAIIDEIKADSKGLRSELTKQPKSYILKKLTIIWGKMSKQGVPLIKEFIKEGIKEAIKIGVKTMIE